MARQRRAAVAIVLSLVLLPALVAQTDRDPEAVSPLGRLLYSKPQTEANAAAFEAVDAARTALAEARTDQEFRVGVLALGTALDAVWRYREAVSVYSRGLSRFPDDGELFLRRGTSSLRLRNFERALTDLRTATRNLERDFESRYRFGLAQFLTGDFRRAGRTLEEAADLAGDDDELVAALHWSYSSYKRTKRQSEIDAILLRLPSDPQLSLSADYYRLFSMYKGLTGEFSLFDQDAPKPERSSTRGFGVANWHLAAGSERAEEILRLVAQGDDWPAIGVIAAEIELERLGR